MAGETVFIGNITEVKGQLAVGAVIKVHAFRDGNGALSAREVEVSGGATVDNANTNTNTNVNANTNGNTNTNRNQNDNSDDDGNNNDNGNDNDD